VPSGGRGGKCRRVTNLVRYWCRIEEGLVTKPIKLLHLFAQASENDYISHLLLWDSLRAKMNDALGNRFTAERYMYYNSAELEGIVSIFEQCLISPGPSIDGPNKAHPST